MSFAVVPTPRRSPILAQVLAALGGGVLLFIAILGMFSGGYRMLYSGRVFPGISMAGVDLSSLTPAAATTALEHRLIYPTSGQIVFQDGNRVWVATPAELGLVFDAGKSVEQAYKMGRQDRIFNDLAAQLNAWQAGLELAPVIIFDERVAQKYLQGIATQIDQPMIETDLHLEGVQVEYTAGQTGRLLNVDLTLKNLLDQLSTFRDGEVALVVEEQNPLVADASVQAAILQQALAVPLNLVIPDAQTGDPGPWTIDASLLAEMLTVERVESGQGWQHQISVNGTALDQFLGEIAPLVERNPQNARFYFDDPTRELVLGKRRTSRTIPGPGSHARTGETKIIAGRAYG